MTMQFTEEYPGRPPKVVLAKIGGKVCFHPNIYPSGAVCLSIPNEDKDWRPTLTIVTIMNGIKDLLNNPNPNSPAQEDAYRVYIKDEKHDQWRAKVKEQADLIKAGRAYEKEG